MKQFLVWLLVFFTTVLFHGYSPLPTQEAALQRDLDALTKRGFTYLLLANGWIEVENPLTRLRYGMPTDPLIATSASGVYFVRLSVNNQSHTKKMVYLK